MEKNKKRYPFTLVGAVAIIEISILIVICFAFYNLSKKEGHNDLNSNNTTIENKEDEDVVKDGNTTVKDNKNEEQENTNGLEIEFSSTGGTGAATLEFQGAPVIVKIVDSGATITYKSPSNTGIDIDAEIYEKYKELNKNIDIDKEKYSELIALINEKFYTLESDLSDNSVMDGASAHITVKNKDDNTSYSVGGYAVSNKIFSEIESKIYETIGGYNVIKDFRKNEMQQFIDNRDSDVSKYFDSLRKN